MVYCWHFRQESFWVQLNVTHLGNSADFLFAFGNTAEFSYVTVLAIVWLKGIVHPKMKILSFTHPQVVPNLYEFLCSVEHKGRYFEESLQPGCFGAPLTSIIGKKNTMEVNGAPELLCFPHSSEYLPLCSAEQRHSFRFGTTWGWVNDDRIFIFPFNQNFPLTC